MKTNFLKATVVLICALVCGTSSIKAQDVLMATLQHGDDVQVFYGATAFQQAYGAAEDGDQITLSGGTFNACDIKKAVKIYGAGAFVQDANSNRYRTSLKANTTIKIEGMENKKGLLIEGVNVQHYFIECKGELNNFKLRKCNIAGIKFNEATTSNCTIDQCYVDEFYPDVLSKNFCINNSIITFKSNNSSDAVLFINNSIQCKGESTCPNAAVYRNSIIYNYSTSPNCSYYYTAYTYHTDYGNWGWNTYWTPSSESIVEHCYDLGRNGELKDFFTDGLLSELKDGWKEKLIGSDLKPMGIYGGTTPFTNIPSNPQIISKEIAEQSDENGKLAVKIVVEAQK